MALPPTVFFNTTRYWIKRHVVARVQKGLQPWLGVARRHGMQRRVSDLPGARACRAFFTCHDARSCRCVAEACTTRALARTWARVGSSTRLRRLLCSTGMSAVPECRGVVCNIAAF
jgi:hypothetical protein